uniref:Uncharacterized protein n=1 Tax=Tanacetum cinerariifolium TaxID=118510 RepID=A0A699HV66_TANCI|nr:hypothetical protein [Tanacetum cinerariifolium]
MGSIISMVSISPKGFLPSIFLLVVVIVTVVIVAVILVVVVVVVAIDGVVIVVMIIGVEVVVTIIRVFVVLVFLEQQQHGHKLVAGWQPDSWLVLQIDRHEEYEISDPIGGLVFLVDLTGDEDPTDEDEDIGMGDLIGVSVSLGGESFSDEKKSQESNIGDSEYWR